MQRDFPGKGEDSMTTIVWIMMITTMGTITAFTAYFLWKVLKTPHESETE